MEKKEIKLSVIIPCFNEEKNIAQNIEKIIAFLRGNFSSFEIIAVNDGSRDNTLAELEKIRQNFPLIIIDNKINEGKGKAVRDGVLASQGQTVMFMDADMAIPIESLDYFFPELDKGYDIIIASRFVPGFKILTPVLWYRKYMEKVFRFLRMIILNNFKVKDTQCGFKVFNRKAAADIFPLITTKRFAFDSEIIFLAGKKNYKIKELPITLQNPEKSTIRIFSDSANMFCDLIKIRLNDLLRKYDSK